MEMPKGVHLMQLTPQKVTELWDKLHVIDGLFDDYTRGNYQIFVQRLQSPDSVYLERDDGNGILYLSGVVPGLRAYGHVVYWDKRLRKREDFTLSCLQWLMSMLSLRKVNVWLPSYAKAAVAFTKRMGFKHEGTLRNWSYSNGQLFDIEAFGITSEEVFNERVYEYESADAGVSSAASSGSNELLSEYADTGNESSNSTDNGPDNHEGKNNGSGADRESKHPDVSESSNSNVQHSGQVRS